jgi:hypothetical protein
MKRNFLVVVVIALGTLLGLELSDSNAQTTNAPSPSLAPAPAQPAPGTPPPPRMPPFPRRPQGPAMVFQRTIFSLRQARVQLEKADSDFGGHKQSAIDACDKAMEELAAVMKATPPMPQAAPPVQPGTPVQGATPQPAPPTPQQTAQ